jgi:hypothetical protein
VAVAAENEAVDVFVLDIRENGIGWVTFLDDRLKWDAGVPIAGLCTDRLRPFACTFPPNFARAGIGRRRVLWKVLSGDVTRVGRVDDKSVRSRGSGRPRRPSRGL